MSRDVSDDGNVISKRPALSVLEATKISPEGAEETVIAVLDTLAPF
jgi:hypothetical protein